VKIFFLRHQAGGVLWEYPFASDPTPGQVAPIETLMSLRFGTVSKKGDTYWLRVVEVEVVPSGQTPHVVFPSGRVSAPSMPSATLDAVGTVDNAVAAVSEPDRET